MADKIEYSKPVPPFVRFCAANIPMVFDDSLSYYEALCALWKWLQTDVIDVINNNAAVTQQWREELTTFENLTDEKIQDLKDLYDQLKEYVDNYFENLDVQEEINNKLDEMAEQGVLADIISQYLNSTAIFGYDSVADMKSAENLTNGSFARTLGYYSKNDGGGALYKIRTVTNDDNVDEAFIIEITADPSNTLVAELIINNEISVNQLGAYGDGTHDDTAKIQLGLDFCDGKGYVLTSAPDKEYLISSPLLIDVNNINFYGSKIVTSSAIDIFKIENTQGSYDAYTPYTIKSVVLDMNSIATCGIKIIRGYNWRIEDIKILNNTTLGFKFDAGYGNFTNSYIYGNITSTNAVGMEINSSDSIFTDLYVIDCNIGTKLNGFSNTLTRIHQWIGYSNLLPNSKAFLFTTSCIATLTDCKVDTYQYALYQSGSGLPQIKCESLHCIYANWVYNHETFNQDAYIIYADDITKCKYITIQNSLISGLTDASLKTYMTNVDTFTGKLFDNTYFNLKFNVANALTNVSADVTTIYNHIYRSGDIVEINGLFKYDASQVSGSLIVGVIPTDLRPNKDADGINTVTFITGSQWSVTEMTPANLYALEQVTVRLPASLTSGNKYIHVNLVYSTK